MNRIMQQPPFLFVDSIFDITSTSILAKKTLTGEEDFFKGHFPGTPLMPGVLLLEAMFQASGPIIHGPSIQKIGVVTRVDKVKFKKMVQPPAILTIKVDLIEKFPNAYEFNGKIYLNDNELVASAQFRTTLVDRPQ